MGVTGWTFLFVFITFVAYVYIGWISRVGETAGFWVAERNIPSIANGAAVAADWMSGASFISMAGLIAFLGYGGAVYLMGWTGGYVLLALLLAPYIRRFGKYTVPEFVGDRYHSDLARAIAAAAAIFVSLTYVIGQMRGVGIVFSRFLQVDIVWGVMIGMVVVAGFAILGGMKGVTWTQVAQYGVLIVAYLIPAWAISYSLSGNPVPQLSFAFSDIVPRLNQLHQDLGMHLYTEPFTQFSPLNVLFITITLMVGTAGLPHIIVRFYTVPTARDARYSAGWALLFIALLYTTAPALASVARLNLIQSFHGKTLETIRQESWVQSWEETGLLVFNDKNGDGVIQMTGDSKTSEVDIDLDIIVLSTPEVAGLAGWVVGLVAAGGLAAAMSTAAGLLVVIASSVAHDLYYSIINPQASEKKQMLVGRILMMIAIVVAGIFGIYPPGFVAQTVAFAFGLAAASFFPIILLGIFDKRTNSAGAIFGLTAGLTFTAIYIIGSAYFGMPHWFFGINAEGIGTVGMLINLVVTMVVSRLTDEPPPHIQALVDDIRKV